MLQRALFAWYFSKPGEFPGLLSWVQQYADATRQLRREEARTLHERRFAMNWPAPEIPAVESGVSENQWQKIFGSFTTGYGAQTLFERFLMALDEYTNPSLRINHRYLGELLPHDNMVSYFAATVATFLNENAVIGKVSPCVTHMEQAAVTRLAQLVGWEGKIEISESESSDAADAALPLQRLPTPYPPAQDYDLWDREQPTGTIVGDGTIANISALLIARNATFNYLLGWGEATQSLGPDVAWQIIQDVYKDKYDRMLVLTSKGAHYSVAKACHMAGVGPVDVIEIAGCDNPWILDGQAVQETLRKIKGTTNTSNPLLLAVVLIAGKTETGYIDKIKEVADVLELEDHLHPDWNTVHQDKRDEIQERVSTWATGRLDKDYQDYGKDRCKKLIESCTSAHQNKQDFDDTAKRLQSRIKGASYNRPFLHVDAAHGGAFLAVPHLRAGAFKGIELADTVTLDGHKMFYCYYPCGGLLIRTTRWARTLHAGHSTYISEDTSHEAYREDRQYLGGVKRPQETSASFLISPGVRLRQKEIMGLAAARGHNNRPPGGARSELQHQPFRTSLEGSRGCQGIMQMYFNLSTIGFQGYKLLLEWTYLLSRRCAEAVSLGRPYVRPVTDEELPTEKVLGSMKDLAFQASGSHFEAVQDYIKNAPSPLGRRRIVPVLGGRLLRLSNGDCNQLLVTYVPSDIAMRISSQGLNYWRKKIKEDEKESAGPGHRRLWHTMHYLWRVNEHLWFKYLYANPAFTYYVGHTEFMPLLSYQKYQETIEQRQERLEGLLSEWNVWARWKVGGNYLKCPFFEALAKEIQDPSTPANTVRFEEGSVRFFAHKIVIMHPYTDESILSDLLGKMVFWGERSADAVRSADAACEAMPVQAGIRDRLP